MIAAAALVYVKLEVILAGCVADSGTQTGGYERLSLLDWSVSFEGTYASLGSGLGDRLEKCSHGNDDEISLGAVSTADHMASSVTPSPIPF